NQRDVGQQGNAEAAVARLRAFDRQPSGGARQRWTHIGLEGGPPRFPLDEQFRPAGHTAHAAAAPFLLTWISITSSTAVPVSQIVCGGTSSTVAALSRTGVIRQGLTFSSMCTTRMFWSR